MALRQAVARASEKAARLDGALKEEQGRREAAVCQLATHRSIWVVLNCAVAFFGRGASSLTQPAFLPTASIQFEEKFAPQSCLSLCCLHLCKLIRRRGSAS
jgi:hypothetical protein